MGFDWSDYLTLAKILAKQKSSPLLSDEAYKRTAISRAYYAVFCSTLNFAYSSGEFTPTGTGADHEALISHFEESTDRSRQKIGVNLRRLRGNRTKAAYANIVNQLDKLTRIALRRADDVLLTLTSLR